MKGRCGPTEAGSSRVGGGDCIGHLIAEVSEVLGIVGDGVVLMGTLKATCRLEPEDTPEGEC